MIPNQQRNVPQFLQEEQVIPPVNNGMPPAVPTAPMPIMISNPEAFGRPKPGINPTLNGIGGESSEFGQAHLLNELNKF